MVVRLLKQKLISNTQNKRSNKFFAEKLFKLNLKNLNKSDKKPYKPLIFLSINYSIPTFEFTEKKLRVKRLKLVKCKPFFIMSDKIRFFFGINRVVKLYKRKKTLDYLVFSNKINNLLIHDKLKTQNKVFLNKNILKFYRW